MKYYKCVRPDGTDFYTGSVLWAPVEIPDGGWLVNHPTSKEASLDDGASTYLSTSTTPTDCTGMRWPCRLLEVVPAGRQVLRTADLPNKRASVAWRVVQELPAWQAFGPQGRQVAAILDRAATLSDSEVRQLDAAGDAARVAARVAAWDAARDAARVAAWDAAWDAARVAAGDAARDAAWDAARDAVRAYLVKDLISETHFNALTDPWHRVVGAPGGDPA